jgi:probable addiction module antidote protein
LEEAPDVFLIALKDVVDAQGGVTKLAKKTGMHRVSLHTLLSAKGNPRLDNLTRILAALGIRLTMTSVVERKRRKKVS